jgi:hypothetical protein
MSKSTATIVREYGPFPGVDNVGGVTFDGRRVWFASGDKLNALDPASGNVERSLDVLAHAGTAFDGRYLFQLAEDRIQKIDPSTGQVLATIPSPGGGGDSGLTWAEGTLWVGHYRDRKIHQIDPETGAILRTIESNRFVTGVTWSTASCGMPHGKETRASCGASIPHRRSAGEARVATGHWRLGTRVRRWRSVLLWRGRSGRVRVVRRPKRDSASSPDAKRVAAKRAAR